MREDIIGILRTIYDPEIPVNIYDIGLIYSIEVDTEARAHVKMTLTSPMCPVAGSLPAEVEMKVGAAPGVSAARVELVWDPPWGIDKMSEAARLQLNL
jgi:FeS assembly SUF system protein